MAVAMTLSSGSGMFAASIPQELEEARMKYERLYKQYTQSLSDASSSAKNSLAVEVEAAKRRYEELKKQFTMSQTTKDKISAAADKVKDTVDRVFSTGSGNSGEAAVASSGKVLAGYDEQKISISGDNYCGQFAMTSVFQGMGFPMDPQKAYKDTNPAGIFTAPPVIVEYLNMNGIAASQKHNASIDDIVKKIDAGKPVIVLVNSGGSTPHWINSTVIQPFNRQGYRPEEMRDSYWGTGKGYEMSVEKFAEAWKSPLGDKLPGSIAGYSNLMIDIQGPREAAFSPALLNFNFNTATEDNIAGGINDVVTGFKRIAPMQLGGGLVKCVLGIPGAVAGVAGRAISKGGDALGNWGKEKFSQDGIGNKLSALGHGCRWHYQSGRLGRQYAATCSPECFCSWQCSEKLGYVFAATSNQEGGIIY